MNNKQEKQEYILCAAIKRIEVKGWDPYYDEMNDICDIEIGYRHYDILQKFQGEVSKDFKDQGFYTSKGRFVDREEAAYIALLAGQIDVEKCFSVKYVDGSAIRTLRPLYSEDLY
jgi:hypothetical protein